MESLEVIILAGGLGTRLRSVVSDRQKVMAPVGGIPVLEIILRRLFNENPKRIILSVGHLKETVIKFINKAAERDPRFSKIEFSEENSPLGTGGAIKKAGQLIFGDNFAVINGDTINGVSLGKLFNFHKIQENVISIAVMKGKEKDGGRININSSGQIVNFQEKSGSGKFVNAGVYILNKKVLAHMPEGPFSIENEFFPKAIALFSCGAFLTDNFIDIGTPERYELANEIFKFRK